jgi:ABC1 atypical kinase-like domain
LTTAAQLSYAPSSKHVAARIPPRCAPALPSNLIEGLISVPLFSRLENVVFHADPHAGNLLYDEARRELVILD